jgi:adenylate cyclase
MRVKLKEWIFTTFAFIFFFYLYAIFSYFGIEDFIQDGVLKDYFNTNVWHLEILISGILLGTLFILINRLTEKQIFRRKSFGFNILFKSTLYLIALFIVFVLLYNSFLFFGLITDEILEDFVSFLSVKFLLSFLIYCSLFILLMNFMLYINKKFGPGSMIDLLTGKYYHPRNEELIFLFLDLKDSTKLAEKLGHNNYSRFIKECIHELTPVIQKYQAKVYQYVGDEVVLFWGMKEGFSQLNCLNAFFEFNSILRQRNDSFISKYGEVPIFKAGMDAGVVTLTEIGDIKREIAFHGDVLNTASRLEKKCNEFKEQFIISQHVADRIHSNNKYHFKFLSDLPLRGKTESIKFYSVDLN